MCDLGTQGRNRMNTSKANIIYLCPKVAYYCFLAHYDNTTLSDGAKQEYKEAVRYILRYMIDTIPNNDAFFTVHPVMKSKFYHHTMHSLQCIL